MNIEIANRLVNLRKSNNLSQEALAEKLGISRQAVSKWERAEASPDTDNLILLARLYHISLDELLKTEDEIPIPEPEPILLEDAQEKEDVCSVQEVAYGEAEAGESIEEGAQEGNDYVHVSLGGVHVKDKSGEVHVGWDGIHVDDKTNGDNIHIDKNGTYVNGKKYNGSWFSLQLFPMAMIIIVAYFYIGCVYGAWHPGWLLFLLIPIWQTLVTAIESRNAYCFAYPVLAALIYLCLGIFRYLWHPGWIIFLTIPLYYSIVTWISSAVESYRERNGGVDEE